MCRIDGYCEEIYCYGLSSFWIIVHFFQSFHRWLDRKFVEGVVREGPIQTDRFTFKWFVRDTFFKINFNLWPFLYRIAVGWWTISTVQISLHRLATKFKSEFNIRSFFSLRSRIIRWIYSDCWETSYKSKYQVITSTKMTLGLLFQRAKLFLRCRLVPNSITVKM